MTGVDETQGTIGRFQAGRLPGAIFAYNHADWYVNEVLALAKEYQQAYG